MKKGRIFLAVLLAAGLLAGCTGSKTDTETGVAGPGSAAQETEAQASETTGKTAEAAVSDVAKCIVAPLNRTDEGFYDYYLVYSHVGTMDEDGFWQAKLRPEHFYAYGASDENSLDKVNAEFISYPIDTTDYSIQLLRIAKDFGLTKLDLNWKDPQNSGTTVELKDIPVDSGLSALPAESFTVIPAQIDEGYFTPWDTTDINFAEDKFFVMGGSCEDFFDDGHKTVGVEIDCFNGLTTKEVAEYMQDHFDIKELNSQNYKYEIDVDPSAMDVHFYTYDEMVELYGDEVLKPSMNAGFFDNDETAENFLFIMFDANALDKVGGKMWGVTLPCGDWHAIELLDI